MSKDSRADRHQCLLTDRLDKKIQDAVVNTDVEPRPGDSVVETSVGEAAMVDVTTVRTITSNYLPTAKQLPEVTGSNENPTIEVDNNVATMYEVLFSR